MEIVDKTKNKQKEQWQLGDVLKSNDGDIGMTKKQQQCPYCHHETGGKHCVLLEYAYLTSNDDYVEANVDIKDKSMFLNIGDYYKDVNDEIKINYCPICGRKL